MGILDTLILILAVLKYYNLIVVPWSSIIILGVVDLLLPYVVTEVIKLWIDRI